MQRRVLHFVTLAGLGAPLVALAVAGLFSRYAADDYCTAGQARMVGFLEAQARLYVGWSGRFAATLPVTLVELIGPRAVPFLPGLVLLAWLAAATWAVRELGGRLPWLLSAGAATLVVLATLQTTADLPQVLFWQTGMLTYLWPLVLSTALVAWVSHAVRSSSVNGAAAAAVSFALAFLAGGTSETFAAAQVTALVLGCIATYLVGSTPRRSALLALLLAGLLGAVLALAIVAFAPGNSVRQETGVRTPLSVALPQALEFTQGWLRLTFARPHAAMLAMLVGIPATLAMTTARSRSAARPVVPLIMGALAVALVILACMLPAFYALGSNPPGRAQVIPQYILVCALAALGWLIGAAAAPHVSELLQRRASTWLALGALAVLIATGPLPMARDILNQIPAARAYAAAWDQLDNQVRAERSQGAHDVRVHALPSTGLVQNLDWVGPNRTDWFNDCVAHYYDVGTIASTLSVP